MVTANAERQMLFPMLDYVVRILNLAAVFVGPHRVGKRWRPITVNEVITKHTVLNLRKSRALGALTALTRRF
ncbi:hypothetical protein EVAR_37434_1 [Eumeta japonica]|uniref:Uncharacterized protein n=1 Tax=Eumeta variegata TaxID=151549 RepID=A0A4C1X2G2_EUMVA|nr:hypothetical protein EVAR_37434_1 [Eumeta japonica]